MMIDWQKVAKENNLSPTEFENEIYSIAACIGAIALDRQDAGDCIKFSCSDDIGPLELFIRRVN